MAEEFQTGICNGNWWNSTRTATVPCTTATNDMGSFGWPGEMVEMKARSCEESVSVSGSSMVFQDALKSSQGSDSIRGGGGGGGGGSGGVLMDSTLQMMGFGFSPTTMDWNQSLFNRSSGRADSTFHSMFQQEDSNSRPTYGHETIMESADHQVQKDWSPKNFSCNSGDSSVTAFKQINQGLSSDQNHLNIGNSSDACTITCQGLPTSFSIDSPASYGYPSTLLQGLFEPDFQSQQSSYDNRTMNYPSSQGNYGLNTDHELSPWQKFPQAFKSSPPKQQQTNQLHFSNNTPFWNASVGSPRPNFFPLTQNQFLAPTYEAKSSSSNFPAKPKIEEVRDSNSVAKKASNQPALKKPRVETQSPLPTFKVRKEKLGDRITALQQLVSPFGKTDTASVLFEAIEYIKFLHDQVSVLSAPYMKNGAPIQHQQQNSDKSKDAEIPQQDLRSRGLCLVPISSTFPVTTETTSDFWTPTFGGTYR